jgi:hypothetical protein
MRTFLLAWMALGLAACASVPPVPRTDLTRPADPAAGLQRYYDGRLVPVEDGYVQKGRLYDSGTLPLFYDAQGASLCASWARTADHFAWIGTLSGLFVFGAGVGLSVNAPAGDAFKNAWWVSFLPAAGVSWTFHWVGTGWFRQPSVALYNRDLAEHLGMHLQPMQDDFQ